VNGAMGGTISETKSDMRTLVTPLKLRNLKKPSEHFEPCSSVTRQTLSKVNRTTESKEDRKILKSQNACI